MSVQRNERLKKLIIRQYKQEKKTKISKLMINVMTCTSWSNILSNGNFMKRLIQYVLEAHHSAIIITNLALEYLAPKECPSQMKKTIN